MRYNKFVKYDAEDKNNYVAFLIFSILLFVSICSFGIYTKGTNAYIGDGLSGNLSEPVNITYYSNYGDSLENETRSSKAVNKHTVRANTFSSLEGYVFDSWNTLSDGSGDRYVEGDVIPLTGDLYLYAQWIKITNDDNDMNDDTTNDDNDMNDDTTDDEVDSSDGNDDLLEDENSSDNEYVPEDDSQDTDSDDEIINDNENNEGSNDSANNENAGDDLADDTNNESTNGSGSVGSGNSSSGNSGAGNSSSGNIASNNTGSNNISSGNHSNNNTNNNVIPETNLNQQKEEPKITRYEFKFVSENKVYASTGCDISLDGTCQLVLPDSNPLRDGFKFKGWSLTGLCTADNIITESVTVNRGNIYYACYDVLINDVNDGYSSIWLVLSIWTIAGIIIYFIIKRFKKKESED